jgi:hypothetical protein
MFDKLLGYILKVIFRTPAKNPLTGDTVAQRMRESTCRSVGCVTQGEYYTMLQQATCRRCGHRNKCAGDFVKEWILPD